jgi:class 3 adenylate cyclase
MAVFVGGQKNTAAARCALRINWARTDLINPALKKQYPTSTYEVRCVTAVDRSSVLVAKTGVRGANDLVWVGRAANHAAKMAALSSDYSSRISDAVYDAMLDVAKFTDGQNMWEKVTWNDAGRTIYRSTWKWSI